MFKLQRTSTRLQNKQFEVYNSDTPVTLKQTQGHQTYNKNVDPKHDYNHAKFEDLAFMVPKKKPMLKFFSKQGDMSVISPEHVRTSKIVVHHDLHDVITIIQKFQFNLMNIKFSVETV